ncbi:MAG: radical SAM protein [Alphaproteobacteria bacterium]|nr:MAG: radical SAM protein [Alphaproteobacteria bacterium]
MPESHKDVRSAHGAPRPGAKFSDPDITLDGTARARVSLRGLKTLWVNTGTLCNVTCEHCYIESSPTNDRLAYFRRCDLITYLDEIAADGLATGEVGFTGGEPFMNPDLAAMLGDVLARGLSALVLTNAMAPMHQKKAALIELRREFGDALRIRVSLDHYTRARHEEERGAGTWEPALAGIQWLWDSGFDPRIAGRTMWGEGTARLRAGYRDLFRRHGIGIDTGDPEYLVLFPEMNEAEDVPEITAACWDILGVDPGDVMCASSRMVVLRKGAQAPVVMACTLIPYDSRFELGATLAHADQSVSLNHPHCAKFCVLGGGSCSGG